MPATKRTTGPKAKIRAMAPAQRYDANIDYILRAAAEVFAEKSFGLASIRDIAAHARISFPRIYYYLRNKEELLFLVAKRTLEQLSAKAEEQIVNVADPEQKLRRFIAAHLDYQLANVAEVKVLVHETQSLSPRNATQIARMMREYSNRCRRLIEQVAAARGVALDRETSRIQISLLFGAMNSVFTWYEPARDRAQQDKIIDELCRMAIARLATPPGPAS